MASTGQTISDRLNAVRYALVGQGLARAVCKATTEEVLGPKKKHIDYLLACTNEPNVSIPQLANLLIERTQHVSWAVVFKALITIHHLMCLGSEKFTQYLATSNHSFNLVDFMDRTTPQGYSMSTFVRRYSKYVNDKCMSYRSLAIDLCKIRSGNDNALRSMNMDKLSKTLPIVQAQFDSLLEFAAEQKDLNNGIIMFAFRLLYKDLVRLYIAYQEAIINLLERYFKLSRKKTREALELYKNYLARMDRVASFLRVVEAVGLDKSEMPDLTKSPGSILKLLEQHLSQLEAKKKGKTNSPDAAEGPDQAEEDQEEKENEDPQQSGMNKAPKKEIDEDVKLNEAPEENIENPTPSTSSGQPAKPAPPQKPARPTPRVSPEISSKPESSTSSKFASSQTQRSEASPKAIPPERPAKPPSRPPPPSNAGPGGSSNEPPCKTSNPPPIPRTPTPSPTPPPPPPPPAHSPPLATSPSSSSPVRSAQSGTTKLEQVDTNTSQGQLDEQERQNDESAGSIRDDSHPAACSAMASQAELSHNIQGESVQNYDQANHTDQSDQPSDIASSSNAVAPHVVEVEAENNEIRQNHVSLENHQVPDGAYDEMPPPPPPIEDIEEEAIPAPVVEEIDAPHPPPNGGQNGSDAALETS